MRHASRIPAHRLRDAALDLVQWTAILALTLGLPGAAAVMLPPIPASVVMLAACALAVAALAGHPTTRAALQLHRPATGSLRWLAVGSLATAVFAPSLALLNYRLFGARPEPTDAVLGLLDVQGGWLAFAVIAIVVAPLAEELLLRGLLMGRLERRLGWAPALFLTALLYAAVHGTAWRIPYFFVMGVLFGGAVLLSRTVWAGVALHGSYNLSLLLIASRLPGRDDLASWVAAHFGGLAAGVGFAGSALVLGLVALRVKSLGAACPSSARAPSPRPTLLYRVAGKHLGR